VVEFDFHHSHTDWCIERKGTGASRIVLVIYTSQMKCFVGVDPALRVHAYSSCSGTRRVEHAQAHLAMPLQRRCMWRTQKRSCRDERPNFCKDERQNTRNPMWQGEGRTSIRWPIRSSKNRRTLELPKGVDLNPWYCQDAMFAQEIRNIGTSQIKLLLRTSCNMVMNEKMESQRAA
jgi:hypothetical protein